MQKNPDEIARAIRGTISIGPGSLKNFSHNGVLVRAELKWQKYCIMDPLYGGLIADDVLVCRVNVNEKGARGAPLNPLFIMFLIRNMKQNSGR
jgi:hypothetical protein